MISFLARHRVKRQSVIKNAQIQVLETAFLQPRRKITEAEQFWFTS